jgi:UDP-N-acetylglucosamine 2-epimerase (non-hydrolysing)
LRSGAGRSCWSPVIGAKAGALASKAAKGVADVEFLLHPNPHVAATMRKLLAREPAVGLLPACGHHELIQRMRDADLILSDSGGIQEEAPALGTPLLVLRAKTQRPEAVACGSARLVGTDAKRIFGEVERLLTSPLILAAMSQRRFPFGDGRAGPPIAAFIGHWLKERSASAA